MFLSVVILGRFTTETHAMALYVSIDTPPLLTPHPGTQPSLNRLFVIQSALMAWRSAPQCPEAGGWEAEYPRAGTDTPPPGIPPTSTRWPASQCTASGADLVAAAT